jgi:hypothetical protein
VAPAPEPASASAEDGHASGFMVQAKLQGSSGLLSLGGGPSFVFGYRGPSFSLGLGASLTRAAAAADNNAVSVTMFQIMPTATFDVWHSRDGRASANLLAGVGYGRASVNVKDASQSCVFDPVTNTDNCSTRTTENSGGISYVPVALGFGGDYFLSRNFALGAEMGLNAAFVTGVDATEDSTTRSLNGSGSMQLMYGALRATLVLGD